MRGAQAGAKPIYEPINEDIPYIKCQVCQKMLHATYKGVVELVTKRNRKRDTLLGGFQARPRRRRA